jgi:hypothetical protein
MKNILYIIAISIFIFYSCDKVDGPYIEKINNDDNNDTAEFVQNILIEDYTAHTCVNCPRAARQLEDIHHTYGDRIIPIAIHVGSLAQPYNPPFDADFRTSVGTELDSEFGLSASGLPKGMINRTEYNGDIKIPDGEWPTAIATFLDKQPSLGIKLQTIMDTINRLVTINVNVHILKDTMENLNLCVYILESGIIGGQLDQEVPGNHVVEDYEFNHTLRASANNTWGDQIASVSDTLKNGAVISSKFENVPLESDWVFQNLSVVAFVYDGDSKEIIQADNLDLFTSYIINGN